MGPLGARKAPTRGFCKEPGASAFVEAAQPARTRRMAQLPERLGLDLPDALTGDREPRTDLLEGVVGALADPEAETEDLLLARRQRGEHLARLVAQVEAQDGVGRRQDGLVLDEVAEVRVLLLADRRLERDRLLRDLHDPPHLLDREIHADRDLLRRGLA